MASTTDPKMEAMKSRVLTHMTADHSDSLALYLNHFCKVPTSLRPPPPIGTLKLEDITLDHIIISHPKGRNLVRIDPPMKHLGEARERLVAMHKECLQKLDMAEFKVDKFVLPNKPWQWALQIFSLMCFVLFTLYPAKAFLPEAGTLASKIYSVGGIVPGLARLTASIKDFVLIGMFAIHSAETGHMAQTRMKKYWVPAFSRTWWMWEAAVAVGGVAGMWRFDDMVKEMEEERRKSGKH
ncbi:hypothetical protein LTS08_003131 [Lithohypha guttulata]|uniref:DUF2470 domain-containing protein n=1 Tax=Lithohypha guttulata TaxID=1690604 RepID=A0AAN7T0G3_9EURO|nr:hypothetical protein LTR05_004690 [Lithohypha guttulata]KAK5103713.1 hypothetical protein LTS08_003131 [Lithohypha guttulata]